MKTLRISVSSLSMAEAVSQSGALPVFPVDPWALSALRCDFPAAPSFAFGLMLNKPLAQKELAEVEAILKRVEDAPAEVIYFSDAAFLSLTPESLRSRLVYRPETLITSANDALFWMSQGIGGVSISPLLTKEELCRIADRVKGAELTVHGHTLLSVSARPLLTSWKKQFGITEEVRHNSHLTIRETTREEYMPVYENNAAMMVFSDYVLESFDEILNFGNAGAEAFFIEGSFLLEEELMSALAIYQGLLAGKDMTKEISQYRAAQPLCMKGFYGLETIL